MNPQPLTRRFAIIGTPPADAGELRSFALVGSTVFMVLSAVTMTLRFTARRKGGQPLKVDDWLILAGFLISLMPVVCIYIQLNFGLGYHIYNLDAATKSVFFKRANQPALGCIKISILCFYMRIFTVKKFKYLAWANIIYTLLWAIIGWIVNILICRPIQFFWDKSIPGGYCMSQQLSGALNGAFGAVGDVLILCLPIYMVWQLQLNKRKKAALSLVFLLGTFVCFASVYRIIVISRAAPEDFTYAQAQPGAWTVIEMHSAIISANLPCLAPLFKTWFRNSSLAAKSTGVPSSNMELRESGQPRSQQSAESSGGDQDGFERLDDSDTGSRADSTVNIRPENTGRIVVETEISAVRRQSLSNSEVDIMQKHKISGWLSR